MNIIFLSELAEKALIDYMNTKGTVILVPKDARFDTRISSHPDLVLSILDDTLIIDENADIKIYQQLDALDVPYVVGNSRLAGAYPQDIAYNAVVTSDYLIHKTDDTNPLLLLHSTHTGRRIIPVKQGYTKCSTVVVNDDTLITSDQGIYNAAKNLLNVLLIEPGHVLLEGYGFGFLGGTSGVIEDTVVFHGDLSKHPDYNRIAEFLKSAHRKLHYFQEFPLTDIGSILVFNYQESNYEKLSSSHNHKHVNIPIFISHQGCPNDCVFCNQRKITAKIEPMTLEEVAEQIETYSSTLEDTTYVELAFFGGSFTGIDVTLQKNYLALASEYKKAGKVQAIRLSTRPDYITTDILERLKYYGIDTIELGVQSLNDEVLKASNRGHLVSDVYQAVSLIKGCGFQLGIQLMVGLPEDTKDRAILSTKLAALLKPDFIRIYPTLVIKETELSELTKQGRYNPLTLETAVDWTKEMYQVFIKNHIPVIRIGLQPTDLISEGKEVLYGPFHPAFRQLVESAYFLEEIKRSNLCSTDKELSEVTILCNPKDLSQVIGHHRSNILELQKTHYNFKIVPEASIPPMTLKYLL